MPNSVVYRLYVPVQDIAFLHSFACTMFKSLFLFTLTGFTAASAINKRACIADNCLRALTGTSGGQGTLRPVLASSDCSTFLSTVVTYTSTPATLTVYATSTVSSSETTTVSSTITSTILTGSTETDTATTTTYYTTSIQHGDPARLVRRSTNTEVPTYASACSGAVRFSSACSCMGILPTTSTSTTVAPVPVRITCSRSD
jgi:hypothetical protein